MAAANKLTVAGLKGLKEPGRYSDGAGLYFKVDDSGRTSRWIFRFSLNNRVTEMGLGGYPAVGLAEAREKAAELRKTVKSGVSPVELKREARAAVKVEEARTSRPTFGQVADDYIRIKHAEWKNDKHRAQWIMTLTELAAPIRDKPVDEIGRGDLVALLGPLWRKTPETASRLRGRIETILDYAQGLELIPDERQNPARWRGPLKQALGAPKKPEPKHHEALPYAEAPAFMEKLRKLEGVSTRALEFLILTAARTNEIVGARWSEIEFKHNVWVVPKERMKMGKEHRVPLTDAALAVLEQLKKVAVDDYIFPSMIRGTPISAASLTAVLRRMATAEAKERGEKIVEIVKADGRKSTKQKKLYIKADITVHGFRSTFRDWAGDHTTFAREVAEAALAHAVGDKAEQAYRRGDALAKRRELMKQWADFLRGDE